MAGNPPWQPIRAVPTTLLWEYVYAVWDAMVVGLVGGLLRWSAHTHPAQIMEFYRERQRDAWRREERGPGGAVTDHWGPTTVIGQAIWHQYAALPESWPQTPRGIVILGLIVTVVGGSSCSWRSTRSFRATGS
jgi:hypothetical protein